jgi:uncharacterized protein YggL (DUF469 family)
MRKRLRKKLRIGEFQELGFSVDCRFVDDFTEAAMDSFMDAFIEQAIEANALFLAGGGDRTHWSGFVTSAKHRGSATEADRAHLQEWLDRRTEVLNVTIGPLTNAWK